MFIYSCVYLCIVCIEHKNKHKNTYKWHVGPGSCTRSGGVEEGGGRMSISVFMCIYIYIFMCIVLHICVYLFNYLIYSLPPIP